MATFDPYRNRRRVLLLGVEATRGVTATRQYAYRWLTNNLRSIPGVLENESAMGTDSRVNDSAIDTWHSEGGIGGKVTDEGIAYLLHGMFNKVTTVDNLDGTYTHTFSRDTTMGRKTFSIWDVRPEGTRLFKSMTMDNLNLSVEVGESGAWLEQEAAFKGWKHEDVTSPVPAFNMEEDEYTSRMVKMFIADTVAELETSQVKPRQVSLQLEETATVDHYVGEVNNDPELDSAPAEARGSMVIKYRSDEYDQALLTNAAKAVKILIENGDTKIEFIGTRVRFREVTDSDDRDEIITQTASFFFESDLANGGKDIEAKVTNRVATLV